MRKTFAGRFVRSFALLAASLLAVAAFCLFGGLDELALRIGVLAVPAAAAAAVLLSGTTREQPRMVPVRVRSDRTRRR